MPMVQITNVRKSYAGGFEALKGAIEREIQSVLGEEGGASLAGVVDDDARVDFRDDWHAGRAASQHAEDLAHACLDTCPDSLFDSTYAMTRLHEQKRALVAAIFDGENYPDARFRLADLAVMTRAIAYGASGPESGEASFAFADWLDDQKGYRETARESLSASSSLGGRWFVYEGQGVADPLANIEVDSPFGQAMANELAGLGWMSPIIPEETVDKEWSKLTQIGIELKRKPVALPKGGDPQSSTSYRLFKPGDLLISETLVVDKLIGRKGIGLAIQEGSSSPIVKPTEAVLLLDKVQTSQANKQFSPTPAEPTDPEARTALDEAKERWEEEFHTPTNDTLVRFRMRSDSDESESVGFVLYSQWRSKNDGPDIPAIGDLRPFAVNQRSSFLTDIFHAYELNGKSPGQFEPGKRVRAFAAHPPINPIVPRMGNEGNDLGLRDELRVTNKTPLVDEDLSATTPYDIADCDGKEHCDLGDHRRDTWISFDLRQGTHELPTADWDGFGAWRQELGIHWDPNHPLDPTLTGHRISRKDVAKYRFFVGCIDVFGQESQLILADCKSAEVGDGLEFDLHDGDYVPRQRRELKGPLKLPAGETEPGSPRIEYVSQDDSSEGTLKIECQTPEREQVGLRQPNSSSGTAGIPREEPDELRCEALIYRRFLRAATEGIPSSNPMVQTVDEQTKALDDWQAKQGFELHEQVELEHVGDHRWSVSAASANKTKLLPKDHGYEYRAAIRFVRKDDVLPYYLPDTDTRPHHRMVEKGDANGKTGFELKTVLRAEINTRSYYELTGIVPAQKRKLKPAKPIAGRGNDSVYISQIGTAGTVSRDRVLGNLLSRTVTTHDNRPAVLWPPVEETVAASQDDWEFWKAWDGPRYFANPAQIAVMQAAIHRAGITRYTAPWRPFVEALLQQFAKVSNPDEVAPTLEDKAQDQADLFDIIGLRGYVDLAWRIEDPEQSFLPTDFVIYLQRGQSADTREKVWTVRARDPASTDGAGLYRFYFPVPGGPAEKLTWWVTSRSSVGTESEPVELFAGDFVPTLVPFPVADLIVSPVPAGDPLSLPVSETDFIPEPIENSGASDLAKLLRNA